MSAIASKTTRNFQASGSDDDTVDEDRNQSEGNKENKSNEEVQIDELKLKKRARHIKPFTEDILTLPLGLQRIYEEFPQSCKFRKTKGSEAKDIKKMMMMYREWAFQLHPGLSYTDIIIKTEQLGGKGKVRSYVQNLREQERDRYATEVLGIKVSEINEEILNSIASTNPISLHVDQANNIQQDIINKTSEQTHNASQLSSNLQEVDYSDMIEGILPWEPEDFQQTSDNQVKYDSNSVLLSSQEYISHTEESHNVNDIISNYSQNNTFVIPMNDQHQLDHSTDSTEDVLTSPEAR